MGMKPGTKLITHNPTTQTPKIQERTGFETAYFIKRIRYADEIPIGIERHYYPTTIGEQLITYDLDNATLYDLVENELGIQFAEANQTIASGPLMNEDKDDLEIPPESHRSEEHTSELQSR